jgi:hypothetical protein
MALDVQPVVVVASIIMVRVIFGKAVAAKVMVLPAAIEKLIVCGVFTSALALVMACLSEPGPLSALLVTVNVVANKY